MFGVPASDGVYYLLTMDLGPNETKFIVERLKKVREHLWLMPGNKRTEGAQAQINSDQRPISWVRDTLSRIARNDLHYIILDTSPTVGGILERAMWASDFLIVPTEAEALSVDGVRQTVETAKRLAAEKQWQGGLLGILPAMVRPLKEHKESLENLRQKFGDLILPEIPSRAAVAECPAYAQTIFEHDPENDASAAYMQLVDIVIKASR